MGSGLAPGSAVRRAPVARLVPNCARRSSIQSVLKYLLNDKCSAFYFHFMNLHHCSLIVCVAQGPLGLLQINSLPTKFDFMSYLC